MNRFQKLISSVMASAIIAASIGTDAFAESNSADFDLSEIHWGASIATDDPSEYGYVSFKTFDENGDEVSFSLQSGEETANMGTLPAKYSMVDKGYLPAVRNQGAEGTCWAHAGMAMAESSMVINGLASASNVDFSEKHLAWFAVGASAPKDDPLYGDFSGLGAKTAYEGGGNLVDVMFTLMAWIGTEKESNVPYKDFSSGVDESYRYHSYGHLQNVNIYDNSDETSIKQAIMRDGAVQIAYYANDYYLTSASNNSAKYAAYYCPENYSTNHSITVVGWDDNFSRSNFKTGSTPSRDGAWLCRNSWGSDWGTNGYFYMSYADATVRQFSSVTMESTSNYGKVYQYDGGCDHRSNGIYSFTYISSTGIKGGANVFTAANNDELTAVAYYTPDASWNYKISIYTDLSGKDPATGTLASAATVSGKSGYAGYHTVKLPKSVAIKKGTKFAVCVDLSDSAGTHYVVSDLSNPSSGRSYFNNYGTWYDASDYESNFGTCNVRVKAYTKGTAVASKPQNVKATAGNAQVTITWDKVSGASNYVVYSYVDGNYANLGTTTSTSFTAKNLTNGKKYGFLVKAYVNGAWSNWSNSDLVYATPTGPAAKPQNVKATAGNAQVTITWDKVSGASNYVVYSYVDGNYANLGTTTSTSFTAKNLTNGKKYGFYVKAYANGVWSDWSSADLVYATPTGPAAKPQNVKATAGNAQVTITWDKVSGASNYVVYSYVDGNYANLGTTTSTSFTAKNLTNGKKYGFYVKAYANGVWSDWSNSDLVYATPTGPAAKPQNVKATAGNAQVTITWDKVSGASNYVVYSYVDGNYANLGTTTSTSFTAKNLTNGKKYGFYVKAYANGVWSDWSNSDLVYATPTGPAAKPQNVKATAGNGQVTITWDRVSGASNYVVYRYVDGNYANLGTTTSTSFTAKNLTNGKKYGFYVKAYVNGVWSDWSNSDLVYATPTGPAAKPQNVKATAGNAQVTITWDKVSGASNYVVYSYVDGSYANLGTTTSTSFTAKNLTNGKKYGFYVKAYVNGVWSDWSNADLVFATPNA